MWHSVSYSTKTDKRTRRTKGQDRQRMCVGVLIDSVCVGGGGGAYTGGSNRRHFELSSMYVTITPPPHGDMG